VLTLLAKGFTKVACLRGGLDAWSKAGGEVIKTGMTPVK
jgi:rhodanese-related sulfurtransferase